jgi:hypothetical protein
MIRTKTSAKIDARQNKYNLNEDEIIYVLDKLIINNEDYYIDPFNNIINSKIELVGIFDNKNNKYILDKNLYKIDEIHHKILNITNK